MARIPAKNYRYVLVVAVVLVIMLFTFSINVAPFRAFGGAVWLKNGVHYISDQQIADRIKNINTPYEATLSSSIERSTPTCGVVDEGFCQQSADVYVYKSLVTPAVAYEPAVPDKKEVISYCTLCGDGTFSPSCAVGRGACSWHSGVASYNVARYRITPGTPAVAEQPAVYSYAPKTYQDSSDYAKPADPRLNTVVNY